MKMNQRMNRYPPMLAQKKTEIFDNKYWIYEPKFDGIRCIAYVTPFGTTLINRSLNDVTSRFPEINIRLNGSDCAVIDGELVTMVQGIPYFNHMQQRMNRFSDVKKYSDKYPATFVAFDLLEIGNIPILNLPLIERKNLLHHHMVEEVTSYPTLYQEQYGTVLFKLLTGWEGIVAKHHNSKYEPGKRSKLWLKIKPRKYLDVYVMGCTAGLGKRAKYFGALMIGVPAEGKYFKMMGAVGTGFTDEQADILLDIIDSHPTYDTRYHSPVDFVGKACVPFPIRVSYFEKTKDGKLRFPSFEGILTKNG